jgi:voltage-gated potassium channel
MATQAHSHATSHARLRRATSIVEAIRAPHVRIWLSLLLATLVVGSAGYVLFFGWSVSDAIYMTVITLTTVGFREVRDITEPAPQVWTMLLAVAGIGIIFGSVGIVAETVLVEATSGRREQQRIANAVAALRDHIIVCGYGRVGSTVARELAHTDQPLVVIDNLAIAVTHAADDGHLVVRGDATEDATLAQAGIRYARALVTALDSDANNLYVTLSARAINPGLFIVARANAEGSEVKLEHAGANQVVSPYVMAGRRISELAIRPQVAAFIDAALSHGNLRFSLQEVSVTAGGPVAQRRVRDLAADGIVVLAVVRANGDYDPHPAADRELLAGETLIVSGATEALEALLDQVAAAGA